MSRPLGLQLYTVRDALERDYKGTIQRIADIGYTHVETARIAGTDMQEAAALIRQAGLQAPSAHTSLPLGDQRNEVLDTMGMLGAKYLVLPYLPPEQFTTVDDIRRNCERMNEANAVARENGLTLLYHNHAWEYQPADFGLPYQIMLEHLEPSIGFELDAYWTYVGGIDPLQVLSELGERIQLLHVKDGPGTKDDPMTAVGEGVLNYEAIIPAAQHAEYLFVELDRCATDMLEAVEKSYRYLTEKGLGNGR